MQNPFTHTFGAEPIEYINTIQTEDIIENFSYPIPSEKCYMITGVRGCGKTVMLSKVANKLSESEDWIVYDLNVTKDMLNQLASKLAEHPLLQKKFVKAKFDFSIAGIKAGIEVDKEKFFDIQSLVSKLIDELSKRGKKILITLDDVSATAEMREFAHAFQNMLRDARKLPVHIIMTGLLSNYKEVTGRPEFKDCTFLTRAFQVSVEPLDISQIAVSYLNVFDIDEKEAIKLAKMTKGYAFAYQVLGWLYFEKVNKGRVKNLEFEYTSELIQYSYAKIWDELSENDIAVVKSLVELRADETKVKREEVLTNLSENNVEMSSSTFNKYRERLINKGILNVSMNRDGYYWIDLPQFGEFVRMYHMD